LKVDLDRLERDYYRREPDPDDPAQSVAFGTSGHRGSSLAGSPQSSRGSFSCSPRSLRRSYRRLPCDARRASTSLP
jgi:hypothetical protein